MAEANLPIGASNDGNRLPVPGEPGVNRDVPSLHRVSDLVVDVGGKRHDDSDEIDLLALWRILFKRRWLILGVVAAALLAALMYTLLTPPVYRATAVLEIDAASAQVLPTNGNAPPPNVYDPDFTQTQIELLKGHALAQRVAEDLNLGASGVARHLTAPSWFQRLLGLLSPAAHSQLTGTGQNKDDANLRRATELVQHGLMIEPVRDSHLVKIHYDSSLPWFSAEVANAVANGFIASSMDRQFGASSYAKKYLEDQLAQLKSRLENSERALVAFAQKENIVPQNSGGQSLAGQNLSDLNASLAKAQDARIRAQARWDGVKGITGASGASMPADMLADPVLQALQQQRAKLLSQYQDQLQTFKPDYPTMLALKSQINEVQKQIGVELSNIRASVKAEFDAASAQETMLEQELANLRTQTLDVENRSIQYNILKRDVDTNRQLYNALLQRYKEVGMAGGVRPSNISIIDQADIPNTRYSPSLKVDLTAGLLVGLMLGALLAWGLEYIDDTLKTPADIEEKLHLPVLGIIPKLARQSPAEALQDPRSGFSESYRSVRTALQFSTERGVPNVLLVTSPSAKEGKSTTALTLARNFTQLGKRVLLIEGDLRNPSLAKAIGLSAGIGLSSLLSGAATLGEVVLNADESCLDVILAGALPPSPTELLAGHKLVSLLVTAAAKYDQVIIDGPPVLGLADAPILANVAAGTLLILKSGGTRIGAAQAAIKRLRIARARLIGGLLTQYDAKASGYGYGYYHDNYYAYGSSPRLTGN